MTPEQQAAYIQSQSTCALIEAFGMIAKNIQDQAVKSPITYGERAFNDLINRYGIHHNAALTTMGHPG